LLLHISSGDGDSEMPLGTMTPEYETHLGVMEHQIVTYRVTRAGLNL
jgi:hypothetical protein